jgi:NurA-like 5'-3' nuclease
MNQKTIPDNAVELVALYINERSNKNYSIPVIGNSNNPETPQIFEIIPFDEIDKTDRSFYAIDGSYNSQQFYNGVSIGIYNAGYICYKGGKQIRMNDTDDPIILGKVYYPQNILETMKEHLFAIYEELLDLQPMKNLIEFFQDSSENIFPYTKEAVCLNLSTLLSFAQEVLEWSLVYEIANRGEIRKGDFILRDGTLRSLNIKQKYLVKLGKLLHEKGIIIVGITKNSPIKMELSYTLRQVDSYLQDQLKPRYPFTQKDSNRQKLCCWFEVPDSVLENSYGEFYRNKGLTGGRGFGLFTIARLDYVEKLQNFDWLVVDVNIFDAIPGIENDKRDKNVDNLSMIFNELTRLTQEHYILGYPYPLVEAHNFISLKKDFKEEIIKRVKFALYKEQRMDNIEIENLFFDIHDKF